MASASPLSDSQHRLPPEDPQEHLERTTGDDTDRRDVKDEFHYSIRSSVYTDQETECSRLDQDEVEKTNSFEDRLADHADGLRQAVVPSSVSQWSHLSQLARRRRVVRAIEALIDAQLDAFEANEDPVIAYPNLRDGKDDHDLGWWKEFCKIC